LGTDESYFSLAYSPDGKTLACGLSDRSLVLDAGTGRLLYRLTGRPLSLSFSRDGKTLLGSSGQRLRLWDAATGRERHEQAGEFRANLTTALSPDGRLLAAAGWMDRAVNVWDTSRGRLLRQLPLKGEERYARNLSFSADGKTLGAAHHRGLLQF